MRVQATKPVKDGESEDGTQKVEPAHKVNWRPTMKTACRKVFFLYEQTSHGSWQELYDDVSERYEEWLGDCDQPGRLLVYQRIATNVLIDATKQRSKRR